MRKLIKWFLSGRTTSFGPGAPRIKTLNEACRHVPNPYFCRCGCKKSNHLTEDSLRVMHNQQVYNIFTNSSIPGIPLVDAYVVFFPERYGLAFCPFAIGEDEAEAFESAAEQECVELLEGQNYVIEMKLMGYRCYKVKLVLEETK